MTEPVVVTETSAPVSAPPEGRGEAKQRKPAPMFKRKLGVANITVVGVGGGGCNTVSRLLEEKPTGMNFVCINTDIKALQNLRGEGLIVLPIGESLTRGFGAGGQPEVGKQAALVGRTALRQVLSGSDIVFITTGLGGGTGTGAAPVVAEIAKKVGAVTVAMVTLPFGWEGHKRMETALNGLARLREKADNMILIHNDRLADLAGADTPMPQVFKTADQAVTEGILVISEIVNTPGDINVDLADVRAILSLSGESLMAIGHGYGMDGAKEAAQNAIKNPLLDLSINGAKGVLFSVKGGSQLALNDVNTAGRLIARAVDPEAMIFFGMSIRPEMGERVKLTVIATGIPKHEKGEG